MMPGGTGAHFEQRALDRLERAGLELVRRNWRSRFGELDLVMRDRQTLVFVEVRYRRHAGFGGSAASIDAAKRARLERAARGFLQAYPRLASLPCRFDVVAFDGDAAAARCDWQRAAFDVT